MTDSATTPLASPSATLLVSCPDRQGIVAAITRFLHTNGGNIIDLEQHVDREEKMFFMRIEWELKDFAIARDELPVHLQEQVAESFHMHWRLYFSDVNPRMAVFVSKQSHCLFDILSRVQSGEWNVDLPLIISNHPDLESTAANLGIDYQVFPINRDNKLEQEQKQLALLREHRIDFIVLARYMQIVTEQLVDAWPSRIINIHHSFLPAFAGARPYHQAHMRGVKIIGATSHYVTTELDEGPIIEQDVVHVRHTDSIGDLIRKGRDIEKMVLARAVWKHLNRQVLVYGNRTIVFG